VIRTVVNRAEVCACDRQCGVTVLTGDEVYSGRAAVVGHEVANGPAADGRMSTADPSHVHVGLCRATDVARRPP